MVEDGHGGSIICSSEEVRIAFSLLDPWRTVSKSWKCFLYMVLSLKRSLGLLLSRDTFLGPLLFKVANVYYWQKFFLWLTLHLGSSFIIIYGIVVQQLWCKRWLRIYEKLKFINQRQNKLCFICCVQLDPELEFDREVYPLGLLPNAGVVVAVSQRMSFSASTEFPCSEPVPQAHTILHCLLRHLLQVLFNWCSIVFQLYAHKDTGRFKVLNILPSGVLNFLSIWT